MKYLALAVVAAAATVTPALAQDSDGNADTVPQSYEGTVFDGDWLSVGIGAAVVPSYRGSDDSVVSPLPLVQGSLAGVRITPRPGGAALDFIPDGDGPVNVSLGAVGKLDRNRAVQIKDPVVKQYGKLDTAVEVGPTAGISFSKVLNPYDSLSVDVDAMWDVAGANKGMIVTPSVTYFTPLSRAMAVSLSLSATHMDDKYADYYYSVPTLTSVPAADRLPAFNAKGGWESAGASLVFGVDLDGNLANGGLGLFGIAGYSRMLDDAKRSPFTSVRGSADQWVFGAGIGYTF